MDYISNVAIEYEQDISWTSSEQQLLWRWEDLQSLLEEMLACGTAYSSSVTYTDDELRYMLLEDSEGHGLRENGTICDVERALELAAQDLMEKYGVDMQLESSEECEVDELTENQLSIFAVFAPIAIRKAA